MSTPSISVMNCGRALSFASHLAPVVLGRPVARELLHRRELHALRLIRDDFLSGHRVAAMRRLRSASASSGKWTRKGLIAGAAAGSRARALLPVHVIAVGFMTIESS